MRFTRCRPAAHQPSGKPVAWPARAFPFRRGLLRARGVAQTDTDPGRKLTPSRTSLAQSLRSGGQRHAVRRADARVLTGGLVASRGRWRSRVADHVEHRRTFGPAAQRLGPQDLGASGVVIAEAIAGRIQLKGISARAFEFALHRASASRAKDPNPAADPARSPPASAAPARAGARCRA